MRQTRQVLPDPATEPTVSMARAAEILGISVRHTYVLAERGELPVIRLGRSYRVPTQRFLTKYGFSGPPTAETLSSIR